MLLIAAFLVNLIIQVHLNMVRAKNIILHRFRWRALSGSDRCTLQIALWDIPLDEVAAGNLRALFDDFVDFVIR